MKNTIFVVALSCLALFLLSAYSPAAGPVALKSVTAEQTLDQQENDTVTMLASLLELQKNLREQIDLTKNKLMTSTSEAEKETLQSEITQLDKQLSETINDFERIATGVEPALFAEKSLKHSAGKMKYLACSNLQSRNSSDLL